MLSQQDYHVADMPPEPVPSLPPGLLGDSHLTAVVLKEAEERVEM